MAKKKDETEKSGEQLDLINVAPKNIKAILPVARHYKKAQAARLTALAEETKYKQQILNLVKEAKLQPLEGGKIKFECQGVIISITPRDELVTVTEKAFDEED